MRNIDDYSKNYSVNDFEIYQVKYRRKKILEVIAQYKPSSILEIGCGYEPLFKYCDDIKFTVIEPSEAFVQNAVDLSKGRENVKIVKGFFEEAVNGLKSEYDMIICSSLLHEVEDSEALLNAIRAICNEGTIVHINVPNANSFHRLLAQESGLIKNVYQQSMRNKIFQQHSIFSINDLTDIVHNTGFVVIDQGSYFVKPFTHIQMEKMLECQIIDEKILDGFYNIEKFMDGLGSEIFVNAKIGN